MKKESIAFYYNLPFGGALNTMEEFAKRLSEKYTIDLYTMEEQLENLSSNKYFSNIFIYKNNSFSLIKRGPLLRLQEDFTYFFYLKNLHKQIAQDIDKKKYKIVLISHDKNAHTPFLIKYLKSKTMYYCQEPTRNFYEYMLDPVNKLSFSLKKMYLLFSTYLRKQLEINTAQAATKILCNSYSSSESIYRAFGVYSSVCHLGVDFNIFVPLKIKKENFVYVIGNLSPHKGHKFVIDAISLISGNIRPRLVIASGGVDLSNSLSMYAYAKKNNVELQILEKMSLQQHIQMYNKAQLTICAAHLETLGLSALESIACETPVVAVREGGYRDIVDDKKTGFLVNRDTKELAEIITKICTGDLGKEYTTEQARKLISKYWSWDQATKRLEKYIESVYHE